MVQDDIRCVVFFVCKASAEDIPGSESPGRIAPTGDVVPTQINTTLEDKERYMFLPNLFHHSDVWQCTFASLCQSFIYLSRHCFLW